MGSWIRDQNKPKLLNSDCRWPFNTFGSWIADWTKTDHLKSPWAVGNSDGNSALPSDIFQTKQLLDNEKHLYLQPWSHD